MKKMGERNSTPYDLSTKGGFKRQVSATVLSNKSRTPYDLNRAVRRNSAASDSRACAKSN